MGVYKKEIQMRVITILSIICSLLIHGLVFAEDSEPSDVGRGSILLESVLNGDLSGLDRAQEAEESIDVLNVNGWSAAHFAVAGMNLQMLNALISRGINLNLADNTGYTPLMIAAANVTIFNK